MRNELIKKHLSILLAGFLHALKGTLAAAALGAGIVLFCCVPCESGYIAVLLFAAALLIIAGSVLMFYSCGADMQKGKFSQ